jgi:transposase
MSVREVPGNLLVIWDSAMIPRFQAVTEVSAFRTRLGEHQAETLLLDRLLEVCTQRGWLKEGGKQRTDSTHVLARVRSLLNRECGRETLRAALTDLAELSPDWLVKQITTDWFERSGHRVENDRLPKAESQRTALAQHIGADGMHLLRTLEQPEAPAELKDVASVQVLRQVWQQSDDLSGGKATWRAGPHQEDGEGVVRSPYDPEAQTGKKRETTWLGYKVHLTETCALPEEPMRLHLRVHVHTTVAPVPDAEMTTPIQEELVKAGLKPEEQIVDTGDGDAGLLVSSQQQEIILFGPTMPDPSWQDKAGKGFDLAHGAIDGWGHAAGYLSARADQRSSEARLASAWRSSLPARCVPRVRCVRTVGVPSGSRGACASTSRS